MTGQYSTSYPAKKIYSDSRTENAEVLLAKESPVEIFLNSRHFTTLFASPSHLKELAVGHMVSEGILSFQEISETTLEENKVKIKLSNGESRKKENKKAPFVSSGTSFEIKAVFAGQEYLRSETYEATRGTHLAALIDREGKLVFQVVDVGRHNAIDKAVGYALLNGLSLSELYILSTGRQPEYMVMKAARAGIPLVVTKAMPFDTGVEAAKKTNLGLVGQLRKESMLVFANEWRVKD